MKFLKLGKDKDGVYLDTAYTENDKYLLDKKGLNDYSQDVYTGERSAQFNYLFTQEVDFANRPERLQGKMAKNPHNFMQYVSDLQTGKTSITEPLGPKTNFTAADFGLEGNENQFDLKGEYLWCSQEHQLPVQVEFGFEFKTEGELIPAWSQSKAEWGGSCDALSWYMGTNRSDFTFRTGLFAGFPSVERPQKGFNVNKDERYTMQAKIYADRAEYSVNGQIYAKCKYEEGTVPAKGHFGFAVYSRSEHKVIDSVKITQI